MRLQELHDIANLFSFHKVITHIMRLDDNSILLRLDCVNYCIDLNKSSPQVYILQNPLRKKIYNAPFDIALSKYIYKANLKSCRLDGMNKILILQCEIKNKYKSMLINLHIEMINRNTNVILVQNNIIISALRFSNTERIIAPKISFTPVLQPCFTKILIDGNLADIKEKLLQNYENMQKIKLEECRKILVYSLHNKLKKLEALVKSFPNIVELKKQREEKIMLANYILMHLDSIPIYSTQIIVNDISYEIPKECKMSLVSDKLFKQAKKIQQKILHSNIQKENLESKITFLKNQLTYVGHANLDELHILQQKQKGRKKEAKKYYETFYIDGIRISMGRNAQENIKLLKDSKADFIWLHILNIPSSHLIIHASKVDFPILEYAGTLLARLCGINNGKIVIDYTKRKFVKIIQGSNVVYSKESKLHLNLS
ncbi:DUF814 domain-containing protein [Helicobacter didelphidarum]|uniref:DUF814 domain-containing protein n=1 Tax=Helicobacter didelphidarum TaxID=2040648 RepID=A0A3D8ICM3_9HELI|nr:DUF814 domain-containing protein [Helicobacter didelphidarum]RDU62696.1 DUF814 domain-containing protein [Helicobacter didelphidarum]